MADFMSMLPGMIPDIFGAATKAYGQYSVGSAQEAEAQFEAKQMMINAGQAQAVAQRDAAEQVRQAKLVQSRIMAVAAAGGGASDPTIMNLISQQAGEGAYRAALAIYRGDDKAREYRMAAEAKRYEGASAKSAGMERAIGTLTGTASSLFSKYNQGTKDDTTADPYPEMNAQSDEPQKMDWWGTGSFD